MKMKKPNFLNNPGNLVESFFLKINHNDIATWIKYTFLFSKKLNQKSARIWFTYFKRNQEPLHIHKTYSIKDIEFNDFSLRISEHLWDFKNYTITGKLENIKWNIYYKPIKETLFLLPFKFLYSNLLPNMKIYTPIPSLIANGSISIDNQIIELKNSYGMFGHNWGKKHSYIYVWSHCNKFFNNNNCFFEGFSAKLKVGNFITPYINMGILSINEEIIFFNHLNSIFLSKCYLNNNKFWKFTLKNNQYLLDGLIEGNDFAYLKYLNPDGHYSICKNTKIANITLRLINKSNLKNILLLKSDIAALEFLYPETIHEEVIKNEKNFR
ncbi:MAG: hypothetical protein KatS3mg129_0423 [Leptospiraceae bacterium]|nr:MAG: hypothetical protein KatS3mg129_0423 [Leptospiraceae bacterium]